MDNKRNSAWKMRLFLVIMALSVTAVLGAMTPDPTPSGLSNAILFGFMLSLMFSFATVVAMIPAPSDPRQRRRIEEPPPGSSSPGQVAERYANPLPYRPMLRARDDSDKK